jgi:fumarate reductase subunit D
LSGLALAAFLPIHFYALARALDGAQALDKFLSYTNQPLFKFAEWGLVVLLTLHLAGGIRVLLIEFSPWSGLRKNLITVSAAIAMAAGLGFALALIA